MIKNTKRTPAVQSPCPACSHPKATPVPGSLLVRCQKCEALHGRCYLGDSYTHVRPAYALPATTPEEQARLRYFDLSCLGSTGVTRRHGWYDPATRIVHQVG